MIHPDPRKPAGSFKGCRDQLGAVLHRGLAAGMAQRGADFGVWNSTHPTGNFSRNVGGFLSIFLSNSWTGLRVYTNIGWSRLFLHDEFWAESSSFSSWTLADWVCSDLSLLLVLVVEWSPQWLRCELLAHWKVCRNTKEFTFRRPWQFHAFPRVNYFCGHPLVPKRRYVPRITQVTRSAHGPKETGAIKEHELINLVLLLCREKQSLGPLDSGWRQFLMKMISNCRYCRNISKYS